MPRWRRSCWPWAGCKAGSYQPLRFTFLIRVMVIIGGSGNYGRAIFGGFLIWFVRVQAETARLWLAATAAAALSPENPEMTADLLAPFDLTGRIALVSGGIGRACVAWLAAYGATVALTCVEGMEDPAAVRAGFGDLAVAVYPLDLRDAGTPDSLMLAVNTDGRCASSSWRCPARACAS